MAYIIQWRARTTPLDRQLSYICQWETIDDTGYDKEEAEQILKELWEDAEDSDRFRIKFVSQN